MEWRKKNDEEYWSECERFYIFKEGSEWVLFDYLKADNEYYAEYHRPTLDDCKEHAEELSKMCFKTLKEIADDLKVDKQQVYRCVKKNHIKEAYQLNQTKYYDESSQNYIKRVFYGKESHQRTTSEPNQEVVFETLLKQLEVKDKQIEELNEQLKLAHQIADQEQKLRMVSEQKILALEEKETRKKWWFGRR